MVAWITFFYFDIKYRTGKSNQVADAFSNHPKSKEGSSIDGKSVSYDIISYATLCVVLDGIIEGINLPINMKHVIQNRSFQNQEVLTKNKIEVHNEMVDILSKVSSEMVKRAQK